MILKLDMHHQGLKVYKVSIIDDPWLTLTYFMARPNLVKIAYYAYRPRCQVSIYRTIGPLVHTSFCTKNLTDHFRDNLL